MKHKKQESYLETAPCLVKLNDFEGPLDLLLFTLKEKKMAIVDLDVAIIANQYIKYINDFKKLNLEIASEYLVMASYLIELKSKSLIPKSIIEIDQEKYEEENRANLIKRLLEYNRFRKIADHLNDNYNYRKKLLTKEQSNLQEFKVKDQKPLPIFKLDPNLLSLAIIKMLQRVKDNQPLETFITKPRVSIEELIKAIEAKLLNNNRKRFHLDEFVNKKSNQHYAATFLLLLDFVNKRRLIVHQLKEFDDVYFEVI